MPSCQTESHGPCNNLAEICLTMSYSHYILARMHLLYIYKTKLMLPNHSVLPEYSIHSLYIGKAYRLLTHPQKITIIMKIWQLKLPTACQYCVKLGILKCKVIWCGSIFRCVNLLEFPGSRKMKFAVSFSLMFYDVRACRDSKRYHLTIAVQL